MSIRDRESDFLDFVNEIAKDPLNNTAFIMSDGMRLLEIAEIIQEVGSDLGRTYSIALKYGDLEVIEVKNTLYKNPGHPINAESMLSGTNTAGFRKSLLKNFYTSKESFEKDQLKVYSHVKKILGEKNNA